MVKTMMKAICVAILAVAGIANAATFRGNEAVCRHLGGSAAKGAVEQQEGVPWEVFGPWLSEQLASALGNPHSFVKDDDDVKFVYESFKRVFDEKLDEDHATAVTYTACMVTKSGYRLTKGAAKGKGKPKGVKA